MDSERVPKAYPAPLVLVLGRGTLAYHGPMNERTHWDQVYERRAPDQVSWYRPHLERSLALVEQARLPADAAIIDVGGGTSTLVDDLLDRGFTRLTVLDISFKAMATAQARLGARASAVTWLTGDVSRLELPEHEFDFWHDRAVFHFLREQQARERPDGGDPRSVRMPMVEVGHVWMRVCQGLVLVRVGVPYPGRQSRMDVSVMLVVVTVAVRMRHSLVDVRVSMPRGQHEVEPGDNGRDGRELRRLNALVEKCPGEDDTEKRRRGKEQLRSGGPELLRTKDVEHDREAVADRPDAESRTHLRGPR